MTMTVLSPDFYIQPLPTAWPDTKLNRWLARYRLGLRFLRWHAVRRGRAIMSFGQLIPVQCEFDRVTAAKRAQKERLKRVRISKKAAKAAKKAAKKLEKAHARHLADQRAGRAKPDRPGLAVTVYGRDGRLGRFEAETRKMKEASDTRWLEAFHRVEAMEKADAAEKRRSESRCHVVLPADHVEGDLHQ